MKRTEVLVVIRHAVGGIRTYLKYVYRHLPADRYHFTVVTIGGAESGLLVDDLQPHQVTLVEVEEHVSAARLLAAISRRLAFHRPDIIHSQGFTAGAISSLANIPWRVPHLVTSHSLLSEADFPRPWPKLRARVLAELLGRANAVQSVTCDARGNLLEYLPTLQERTALPVVVHGIDTQRFLATTNRSSNLEWRATHQIAEDAVAFGFLGRPMPEKGFEQLVDAVQILASNSRSLPRPFSVVVAGDGGYIREYQSRIRQLGLERCFRFVGFVPDVAPLLHNLDTVVIPSLGEACCLLAMESLVAGCPVIATSCVGLREIVADTPASVVPPGDAAALARAMRARLADPISPREEAGAFAVVASRRFDCRRVATALEACFEQVIGNRRAEGDSQADVSSSPVGQFRGRRD